VRRRRKGATGWQANSTAKSPKAVADIGSNVNLSDIEGIYEVVRAMGSRCGAGEDAMSERSSGGGLRDGVVEVTLIINGRACKLVVEPRLTLLDALREELALTGTKKGCDRGECGACTVHIEGRRILSCMTLAAMHEGKRITTIEGIEQADMLDTLQAAFIEHDGFQCGFCTSGQIMSSIAMIAEAKAGWPSAATADVAQPFTLLELSNAEIRERMSGNLCRCACYPNIVDAIADAVRRS
jgi:xanthine dehydrogenase YagT iron-sulfur-binding subunit